MRFVCTVLAVVVGVWLAMLLFWPAYMLIAPVVNRLVRP